METTIQTKQDVPQQVRASVNERMFFKTMQHLFSTSFSVMGELIQNARRAGARRIDISLDAKERTICVTDNGCGIEDFEALLDLATSGWSSEEVQLSDKPFGMGFFSAFYACDSVVVYSRRRRLQASRDDIIERRSIDIVADDTHRDLTRIELHGVSEQLLRKGPHGQYEQPPQEVFEEKLKTLVAGFPVPVFFNGAELERPVAWSALAGEMTEIGFVSVEGIHREGQLVPDMHGDLARNLWLQGLPIEASGYSYHSRWAQRIPRVVVHLNSAEFQARMPDRSHLYDSQTQLERIDKAVTAVIRKYIIQQKAKLDPADFTRQYWKLAGRFDLKHLFIDVPYLPLESLARCTHAVRRTEYQDTTSPCQATSGHDRMGDLISRQDILDGRVKVWRDTPSCVDDDPWAAVAMKVMQRQDILGLDPWGVAREHWIRDITPSFNDMVFEVQAQAVNDRMVDYCWSNSSAKIRLAKELRVVIRSLVDERLHLTIDIDNDWLLVPQAEQQENASCDFDYDCWLIGNQNVADHPVNALATFYDENDRYREDWEAEAIKHWDDVVSVLRQEHLASTLQRMLTDTPHIGDERVADCAIVSVQRFGPYGGESDENSRWYRRLRVTALDGDLLSRLCTHLYQQSGVEVRVEELARALSAAVRPGSIEKQEEEYLPIRLDTQAKN